MIDDDNVLVTVNEHYDIPRVLLVMIQLCMTMLRHPNKGRKWNVLAHLSLTIIKVNKQTYKINSGGGGGGEHMAGPGVGKSV